MRPSIGLGDLVFGAGAFAREKPSTTALYIVRVGLNSSSMMSPVSTPVIVFPATWLGSNILFEAAKEGFFWRGLSFSQSDSSVQGERAGVCRLSSDHESDHC